MSKDINSLFQKAKEASQFAHAPYSKHHIGSAIRIQNGKIYSGCNVENASYGGTVCAERVAIWKAASENKNIVIEEVCVFSDAENPWPPCGFCRQVIAEFSNENTVIHVSNNSGIQKTYKFTDLLPQAFSPIFLRT